MKIKSLLLFIIICLSSVTNSFAWGYKGHEIVVQLAMRFVKPDVNKNIISILDTMSFGTAGNWMDMMRSNSDYNFMKPWHYIDFPEENTYQASTDENIVNRIIITYNELRHKNVLCNEQIKMDMLVLMHLMGDLHQPLHTGYENDLGGNKVAIEFDDLKTNLHHFWDEDIIQIENITLQDCLDYYSSFQSKNIDSIAGIHPVSWMKETRSLLDQVYLHGGFTPDSVYMKKSKIIIEKQLLIAGLRLAQMLNKVFYTPSPIIDMTENTSKYNDGIDIKDVMKYVGKKVTICSHVYGIKTTDKVSFINVGANYPNSPLTIVIFEKDKIKFLESIDDLYTDKNICIHGTIVEYNGKAEIVIDRPEEIIIL